MAPRVAIGSLLELQERCHMPQGNRGCWTWAAGTTGGGRQPSMRIRPLGLTGSVGMLFNHLFGADPDRPYWFAKCGNPLCVRPHPGHRTRVSRSEQMRLAAPTRGQEQRASIARGRLRRQSRIDTYGVHALRCGLMSTREAADRYGITVSYAWSIKVGRQRTFDQRAPKVGSSVFFWTGGSPGGLR